MHKNTLRTTILKQRSKLQQSNVIIQWKIHPWTKLIQPNEVEI